MTKMLKMGAEARDRLTLVLVILFIIGMGILTSVVVRQGQRTKISQKERIIELEAEVETLKSRCEKEASP